MASELQLLSLSSNPQLAQEIATILGLSLSECKIMKFADGETMVRIKESVRGDHVYVIQTLSTPVNDHLMELLITVDALKRASAKTINLLIPYFGYARQDRKLNPRDPITAKLVADLLTAAGCTRIITMDLHASQLQGFFNIPIDDFRAMPILAKYFIDNNISGEGIVVISPDHGGANRAKFFADAINAPLAIIDKRRPKPNVAEVVGLIGEVDNKVAIIIDDIIDTGNSICRATETLLERGCKEVYVACTHAVLSGDAADMIQKSKIKKMIVTNTIPLTDKKKKDKIISLSVSPILGRSIQYIYENRPVSELFDPKGFLKPIERFYF